MLRPPTELRVSRNKWDLITFGISFSNIKNSVTKTSRGCVARNLHFLAKGKHIKINYLGHAIVVVLPKENTV